MLLSRVAEDLYWMARYLERAQASARVIMEHTHLLVDLPMGIDTDFTPLLAMMGSEDPALASDEFAIIEFLIADPTNPSSILSSLRAARENMRSTRQLLPIAAWECLNPLYRRVAESTAQAVPRSGRAAFCQDVISSSQQLLGIFEAMMSRDHAHGLTVVGRQIERADMTTRVLDVRAGSLYASGLDEGPHADVRWLGVLRCLGAHQMYRRTVGVTVDGYDVLNFLIHDPAFPRSVARCLDEIEEALLSLPKNTHAIEACREARILLGESQPTGDNLTHLHDYVDKIQLSLAQLHHRLAVGYFAIDSAPADLSGDDVVAA